MNYRRLAESATLNTLTNIAVPPTQRCSAEVHGTTNSNNGQIGNVNDTMHTRGATL